MSYQKDLKYRLMYLWTFELIGAALISWLVWLWWARDGFGTASAVGLGLVIFLLIQGSLYWYRILRSIQQRSLVSKQPFIRVFAFLKVVNRAVLAIALLGGIYIVQSSDSLGRDVLFGGLLWTFAVLEYVNYFHRQLMYDSPKEVQWILRNRRLKIASLARHLADRRL